MQMPAYCIPWMVLEAGPRSRVYDDLGAGPEKRQPVSPASNP